MTEKSEFIKTIQENQGIIFKISKLYAANVEDQKDLFQDIVYQLWKSYERFRGDSKISTWLYRVALNTSIAHLNKHKRKVKQINLEHEMFNMAESTDHAHHQMIDKLYSTIRHLSQVDGAIILLHLEGKKYSEIADVTGFSETNIGTRLTRIKEKLKSQMVNE